MTTTTPESKVTAAYLDVRESLRKLQNDKKVSLTASGQLEHDISVLGTALFRLYGDTNIS